MGATLKQSVEQSVATLAAAAIGFAGFGFVFADSPGPLWATLAVTAMAVVASCVLAVFSPGKWLLIAVLCSWGSMVWAAMGFLMRQPKLHYLILTLPLAAAAAFIGSRSGPAGRRRAG